MYINEVMCFYFVIFRYYCMVRHFHMDPFVELGLRSIRSWTYERYEPKRNRPSYFNEAPKTKFHRKPFRK